MIRLATALALLLLAACGPSSASTSSPTLTTTSQRVSNDGYLDKTTVGYQGWFATPDDGSTMGEWVHWAPSTAPAPGHVTTEIYPDTREYDAADLHDTGLGPLGDGRSARLFSSHSQRVVDTHFRWMEEAGIDGVGLQRFLSTLVDPRHLAFRNDVTQNVRAAAEAHGRVFYVEYDISGANESTLEAALESDWTDVMQGQLDVTDSPAYLTVGGRPVVALWGFGFPDRPGTPAQAAAVAEWFHAHGCYVIAGVPYQWRTGQGIKSGFLDAYWHFDVIQPWAVGALATEADAEVHRKNVIAPDLQLAAQHGVGYQRVLFPGFAWSNWNGGARNMIPRHAGRFLWAQALALQKQHGSAFIAMFDEYDEGTAIAKAAEDASQAPTDQYYLTLDADGERVSSDFYLRLSGAVTQLLRGQLSPSATVPVPAFASAPPQPPPSNPTPPGTTAVPRQSPAADATGPTFTDAQAQVVVERLYRAILGRDVDSSGEAAYVPLVQQGRLARVVNALATSGEFEARRPGLDASGWADALYQELLDRGIDPSGLTSTTGAISAARGPQRIVEIVTSPEYAAKNP